MPLAQGDLLNGRYRILDVLGHGGMGSVYRAHDESLSVEVAVKENLFTTEDYALQFRTEALILASLRHPNLPRVTDHFVLPDEGQYLVMDYVEGLDLRQVLEKDGVITEQEAVRVGAAICDALTYLHTRKPPVLHRDIKLGNVKLSPDGGVILVDFGLAKIVEGDQPTMTGARAMTPGYSPPEQYGSARTDPRSDIYSLGATLYAAVTGFIPEDSLMRAVDGLELTPVRKRNPKISARVAAVLEKAMETTQANRYQTAEEFKAALLGEEYISKATGLPIGAGDAGGNKEKGNLPLPTVGKLDKESEAGMNPPSQKTQRPSLWWGLFFLALVAGVIAIAWFYGSQPATPATPPTNTPEVSPTLTSEPEASPTAANETEATPTLADQPTQEPTETTPPPTDTPESTTVTTVPVVLPSIYDGHLIAFASMREGLPQIYVMNPNGSGQRRLFFMPDGACQPTWAPDGKVLAFISPCNKRDETYKNNSSIYVFNLSTQDIISLSTKKGSDFDPDWSPDGTKIAFTSTRDGYEQIYVMKLPETFLDPQEPKDSFVANRLNTTAANEPARQPAWSPDGKKIAYSQKRYASWRVWLMNADGSDAHEQVTNTNTQSDYHPRWSLDGLHLYYSQTNAELTAPAQLMMYDFEKQTSRDAFEFMPLVDISFAPNGEAIVFESSDGSNQDIFLMVLSEGKMIRLTDNINVDFDPDWQP